MKTVKTLSKIAMAACTIAIVSCKKDKDKQIPPNIAFKTSAGYTYTNATVTTNDTLLVGITAEKTEDKDLLTRFVATQKYDAGSTTTLINESFNQDTYSKDMQIITRNIPGTETYTYTIINRDGLTATKTLVLTVN
jgi:hypothetical protein